MDVDAAGMQALNGAGVRSPQVLVVDDNATNQIVMASVMETFGLQARIVGSGREAIEAWRDDRFDLILMDVQMPGMDGVEAVHVIRLAEAAEAQARTPILMLSANVMPQQVSGYLAAGADGHVAKPIELTSLRQAMERVAATLRPNATV